MIRLDLSGSLARLTLDRAHARNALDAAGWTALAQAVDTVARSDARVLLVAAAQPGAFCAGADLREIATLAEQPTARPAFRQRMRAALDPLHALAIPTIAAIDGDCFGAGVALAVACDIRIAGSKARFAVPPAKLGIAYPKPDIDRIVAAIGKPQAARLFLGAATIDADEAARIGLVQIRADSAIAEAETLAPAIAANAAASLAALKALIAAPAGHDLDRFDAQFDALFGGEDLARGLAAFKTRNRS